MSFEPLLVGGPDPNDGLADLLRVATGSRPVPRPLGTADDDKFGQGIVSLVMTLRREAERDMSQQRQRWAMTDAFIGDSQWMGWNARSGQMEAIPRQKGRPRIQCNIIKPAVTRVESRLLGTHPQIRVEPGSADDKVVGASKVATQVLQKWEWQKQKMDGVMAEYIPGYYRHGDAALKVEWDPQGGRSLGPQPIPLRDETGNKIQAVGPVESVDPMGMPTSSVQPLFDEDGITPSWEPTRDEMGQPVMQEVWEGCSKTYYISSSDIFWDPAATRPADAMWVLLSIARSPAWIYNRYGVEVEAQPAGRTNDMWRFNRNLRANQTPRTTQVDELWIKAGKYRFGPGAEDTVTFAKGFVVIVAGNRLLDAGPNPYEHGEFPIIFERALLGDKQMRGDTPVNSEREIQVAVNKILSTAALNIDMTADNQWLIPSTCQMPESSKRNGPGVYKMYVPDPSGAKPEQIPGMEVPASIFKFLEVLTTFMADVSGQHEGGMAGGVPPNIEAGVALEALVERDTTALTTIALGIGRTIERWSYLTLSNWKQFVSETRQVAILGEWDETEVHDFSGTDIYDSFLYTVVPASVLPQSKAAEFQKSLLMLQSQLITPRDFFHRTGEDRGEVLSQQRIHAANARFENQECEQTGMPPTTPELVVMQYDDDVIHDEEHSRKLLDRKLWTENPNAWMALFQHNQIHRDKIAAAMAAQQAQAQAASGEEPSQGGPASPPSEGAPPGPPDQSVTVPRPGISGGQ